LSLKIKCSNFVLKIKYSFVKVDELRVKLSKLNQEDLIKLAVEFYKLVPKAKKEDANLDELINSPTQKVVKPSTVAAFRGLVEIESEVDVFLANARAQNYLVSNKIIPKKERATWRFKVKAWYKELTNPKNSHFDTAKQTEILLSLYTLLAEACGYQYFTSEEPFESVGVPQTDFYRTVLQFIDKTQGKTGVVNRGIGLIVNNNTGYNTSYSNLMTELIPILETPDAKYHAIEVTNRLIQENNFTHPTAKKGTVSYDRFSSGNYQKETKNNHLAELGFRLYASLYDYHAAIEFYETHHYESDTEVKLYILTRLLVEHEQKDAVKTVLNQAIKAGEKPRSGLLKLLKAIEEKNELPRYF
jgi:hypothetical protein